MKKTDDQTKPRVTMKDVALAAGVSQSTVSFVLNGVEDMRISRDTRNRVLEAVRRLGYRQRGAGRPPKATGRGAIGLMFDEIATSPFAAISIEGVQEEAWKNNVIVEVVMTGRDPAYEDDVLRRWADDDVLGVIYASILTRKAALPELLGRHETVLLNCYEDDERFPSVVPAERRGGQTATEALIAEGHRKIAFITGEPWMEASAQRWEGYHRAMRTAGLPIDPGLVVEGNFLPSGGRQATLDLMSGPTRPDAIFCANDLTAVGCFEALKELGERIGETIAVMGYDDQEIAQHLSPALSTVLLPHREMGALSVRRLLQPSVKMTTRLRLQCPLVLRQSHRGLAKPDGETCT